MTRDPTGFHSPETSVVAQVDLVAELEEYMVMQGVYRLLAPSSLASDLKS